MRLHLGAAMLALSSMTAQSATVEFQGMFCLTAASPVCGWEVACQSTMRYLPPNLGDNGPQTNITIYKTLNAENLNLPTGSLVGSTFKTVNGTGLWRYVFFFTAQMKITKQTPSILTDTTPFVNIAGKVKDFDGTPGCDIDFRATGALRPN